MPVPNASHNCAASEEMVPPYSIQLYAVGPRFNAGVSLCIVILTYQSVEKVCRTTSAILSTCLGSRSAGRRRYFYHKTLSENF